MASRREARLEVMGTFAHVIAIGDESTGLVDRACAHLRQLEARWSRFDPASEVSRLNANNGRPLVVSAPTVALIQLGLEGWRVTGGRFDPTVLGDVVRSGYDRSFRDITPETADNAASSLRRGCDGIEVDADSGTVRLPFGVGIDPGGLGKGLAADLVVDALLDAGAGGACVNVGGDLRVAGASPIGGWVVALDDHRRDDARLSLTLVDGAIATSATVYRSWHRRGTRQHHLIDPNSGRPIDNDIATVSVAAARGWQADVLTKAIYVAGAAHGLSLADELGAAAIVATSEGGGRANRAWRDLARRIEPAAAHRGDPVLQ